MKEGLVIKSTGNQVRVMSDDGAVVSCFIKGRFRVSGIRSTNPVAVGDRVRFEMDPGHGTGVITKLLDRRNYIIRKSPNLSKQSQIIAANVDHVFLMVTITEPETPVEFIDRFLVTTEAYRIKTSLIFNKTDLYDSDDTARMDYLIQMYNKIGYECFRISLREGRNLSLIIEAMKGKISLISGNSGVGKSTLLNCLNPGLNIRTAEISEYHRQGKHVTTFPEMHPMPFGGYIIDTPGIKGFGVIDMDRNEIYHFFPEIFRKSSGCRFHNCLHLEEPGCAVRAAVETGEIDPLRYRSYISLVEGDDRKYR